MANFKRTYINADEELVIQGKLTIEGELEQKEFVETSSFSQTNFSGDVLVVNADGFTKDTSPTATNSELKLRSGDANASLLFNSIAGTLTLSTSPAITTTLTVDGDISATDITASGTITGALSGNATSASTATQLTNNRNFSITGDVQAGAVSFNGTTDVVLSSALGTGVVGPDEIAANSIKAVHILQGNAASVLTTHIGEGTNLYYTDARAQAAISVTDSGGDGSLVKSGGVITYTGPSAAEVRAHFSGTAPIGYNSTSGAISFSGDSDDISQGSTNLYFTTAQGRSMVDAYLVGGTGITYASGTLSTTDADIVHDNLSGFVANEHINHSGVTLTAGSGLTGGGDITASRTFAVGAGTGITVNANDIQTNDSAIVHDNLSGFVANEHVDHSAVVLSGGTGITTSIGDITASRSISIDATVATLTGTQTLTNKTLTSPTIAQIVGNLEVTGDLNIVGNMNSATQTDSFITTKTLYLNVGGGATPDSSRVEVDRTGTGSNTSIRWNETGDRWMFSNNGSTNNNMLLFSDFSASSSGDGSLAYNNGVYTYTGPSAVEQRAHISVTDAGGDGSLAYNNTSGVITYTGPSAAEVRAHITAGTAITISSGAVSLGTVPNTLSFTQGHVKFDANSIGIGPSAGTFNSSEANSIAIGNTAGTTTQQSGAVAIGVEAGKTSQIDAGVALGWKAGWNNQGGRTISGGDSGGTGSAVAIGTSAGYTNQGEHSVAIGPSAGLVQQQEHSIAIGRKAGNTGQSAYSIAIGVEAGETTQGDYSIAIGHKAGETSQASDTIVLRAGDSGFAYPAAATAGATYITPLRNTTTDTGKVAMYNDSTYELSRVPSTIFVSSTATQSITGTKTFSDGLIVPASATATNGAIYVDNSASKAYVYVNGSAQEITPASSVGTVEDVGATGTDIYAGSRASGATTYHGIKSLAGGTGVTLADSGNVITVTTDAFRTDANVRALFSAVDASGDGALTYNNSTGAFTYSGITDSQIRGKISGTGLISYDNSTGVISTTADNYSSFTVQTDTGGGGAETITSGETLTFVGGTNTTVTNSGNTITIRNDNDADIEAVTAGSGLTGGGSSGAVTLNVIGGDGITANADDIALSSSVAGTGLTFTSGVVNAIGGTGITANANDIAIDSTVATLTGSQTLTNKTLTSPVFNTGVSGSAVLDSDTFSGASATTLSSSESIKAYVDTNLTILQSQITIQDLDLQGDSGGAIAIDLDTESLTIAGGTGISTVSGTNTLTINVGGLTTAEIAAGSLQLGSESFSDSDSVLMTAAAVQDKIEAYGYGLGTGDITAVVAGTGLTGGANSGSATLNVNTGAVSNGASTIPTGDQVYDFVIGLGYSTTTGTTTASNTQTFTNKSGSNSQWTNDAGYTTNTGDIEGVTAGVGLSGGGTTGTVSLAVDLSELTDMTAAVDGSEDELILLDGGADRRKLVSEINLGQFNNDQSWTSNVGDITGVAVAGTGLSGGGTSGAVTITSNATAVNTASTIVARDASGDFAAGTITALATSAQYADLAENYSADADYEVGTVVVIGGEQEITTTGEINSTKVAGVISSDPAYLMNADCGGEFPKSVALRGRVPVKVIGVVQKGDVLITSDTPGFAMTAANPHDVSASELVGKSLESKLTAGGGVIEALI